ncbi:CCAAT DISPLACEMENT PROTEIN-RELATED [Salix koriyanagi]|uniref:CCAAT DISPLACEMENT PROTEIN-RELATED n=1 Tax=Salix koriyanagi TaxID=2511006 RepID=A0A9Q0WD94_9ROSI|nr:CCAAT DISPLACEMENT PROTEIN-RELATED [Salix koriyanagi]
MEVPQVGSERDKTISSSPVSLVSNFWKDFELEKEKSVLDEQGLRIAENQENSQKNRRKLAESTRDFKKASSDEKLGPKLYEAPDPYPALASISEQDLKLSELESESRKMKVELEEFRTEAAHLKNQQATIRRLEERNRQLEQQMEEKVKEIVEMKQRSLAEENQKTLEVLKEREQSLQDQLRQAKDSVATIQKLHELAQSQLFEVRAQSEEEWAAKQSEVNLLMDEVERAQTRLFSLEREKGVLRSQLQSANEEIGDKKGDNSDSTSILESSLSTKEKLISELNMELHNIETTLTNEREQHINEIKKLNILLNEKVWHFILLLLVQ